MMINFCAFSSCLYKDAKPKNHTSSKGLCQLIKGKHNASYSDIAKECKISKLSSHRICSLQINEKNTKVCKKKGMPQKLD